MLAEHDAAATVAVKDLQAARKFYESALGLEPVDVEGDGSITYRSGSSSLFVYVSDYAGTNQATAVTWNVDDVEQTVRELRARGVTFEHYDLPDTKRTATCTWPAA